MINWRKSTHSGGNDANCVEAAKLDGRTIGIRDSKNPSCGHLTITRKALRDALTPYLTSGADTDA